MQRTRESLPRLKARVAGGLYLLAVFSAVFAEAFLHGRLLRAVGLIPIVSFTIVTLLLYQLLKPANRSVAGLAAFFNLVSLTLEAFEFHLQGANIALIFHGLYCLLIGFLAFRSDFVPQIFAVLMAIGGLAWLTDLSIPLTNHLAPYNVIVGFTGEGMFMLWLLVIGPKGQRWDVLADAEVESVSLRPKRH